MVLPGLGGAAAHAGGVQVTAVGATPAHCKLWAWSTHPAQQGTPAASDNFFATYTARA